MATGTAVDDGDFILAIVGGTGDYLGVTGQMSFRRGAGPQGLNAMVHDLHHCLR